MKRPHPSRVRFALTAQNKRGIEHKHAVQASLTQCMSWADELRYLCVQQLLSSFNHQKRLSGFAGRAETIRGRWRGRWRGQFRDHDK
jgi:hypothetical protein